MTPLTSSLILIIYFTGYALVHSWLAGADIKARLRQIMGPAADRWYRLGYNVFAIITLLPMFVLLVVLPSQPLYVVLAPWRWLMMAGRLIAAVLAIVTLQQTGLFHFIGLTQVMSQQPDEWGTLNIQGFYAWVRHPLYFFSLLFMWLGPAMDSNTLTTFILFSLYFYFGSMAEERRLVDQFGPVYENYQQQVPRLIPWPGHRYRAG